MTTFTHIDDDAVMLLTSIPESWRVDGLEYGAHINRAAVGWTGYYVRPQGTDQWCVCRLTPAVDELPGDGTDVDIVAAVISELAASQGGG